MSVMEASRDTRDGEHVVHEVIVDLRLLRDWSSPHGLSAASLETDRVRLGLVGVGVAPRSAARIVSAIARYAFLTGDACNPAHRILWRLYAVDGVPPQVLAQLTWQQVRLRLREIVVTDDSGTRYFALSAETCRLLMQLRDSTRHSCGPSSVFTAHGGEVWQPESLVSALTVMSVR
ncbi:MAG: hypothetical protein RL134_665 [Actinomycetota bacterium]